MTQIASGGISLAGLYVEQFTFSYLGYGSPVEADVGKAAAYHTTANTVKLATGSFAATAAATAGNTGNPTSSAVVVGEKAKAGVYKAVFTAATAFGVYDPDGYYLGAGTTGSAFTSDHITFTLTAGATAAVAGDRFNFTATTADRVIGQVQSVEPRTVEGVTIVTVCHKGGFRFYYTGTLPVVGESVAGSDTAGKVIAIPYREGWGRIVEVNSTSSTVVVQFD